MEKGFKSLLETVSHKHWFEDYLEKAFLKEIKVPEARDYFYAGWAGQCPKMVQLTMNGLNAYKPLEFRNRKAFEYGTLAHERYQRAMKNIGVEVATEIVVKGTFGTVKISGKADLVVWAPDSSKRLIELKTINGTEYKKLKAPKYDHLCQWIVYSKMLNVPRGIIVYENKDDVNRQGILPELLIFEATFDQAIFDKIILDFAMIQDYNSKSLLVPRPEICLNPQYCEIKTACAKEKLNV